MNKSIPSFVIGLIFSLIGGICACLFWIVFVLIGAIADGAVKIIITIFPFINVGMFVLSLVGSLLCLKRAKIGGIILLISSIISLICFAAISISLKTFNIVEILFWIPTVFIMVAGMLALKDSKKPS